MSAARNDVDEADRLVRVRLSCTIEPGDLRVTGLVSELGAGKVLGYLEAAADADEHWPSRSAKSSPTSTPGGYSSRQQTTASGSSPQATPNGPTSSERSATPAPCTSAAVSRSGCGSGERATSVRLPRPRWRWSDRELRPATAGTRRAL